MRTKEKIVLDERDFQTKSNRAMSTNEPRGSRRFLTTPLSSRGFPRPVIFLMSILGFAYILNPGLGFLEFIPDNLPFIGNLDEGGAYLLLWYGLIELFEGRRNNRA